jgi:hypothetical protein
VPFFIEEFIGFLNNLKIVKKKGQVSLTRDVKDTPMSLTIQDVIMSGLIHCLRVQERVLLAGRSQGGSLTIS